MTRDHETEVKVLAYSSAAAPVLPPDTMIGNSFDEFSENWQYYARYSVVSWSFLQKSSPVLMDI